MAGDALEFSAVYGNVLSVRVTLKTAWKIGSRRGMDVEIFADRSPSSLRFSILGRPSSETQMLIDGVSAGDDDDDDSYFDSAAGRLRAIQYFRLIDSESYIVCLVATGSYEVHAPVTIPRMVLAPAIAEAYGLKPPPGTPKPAKR